MVGMSFQNAATLALSQRMLRDSKGQNQDQRRVTIGQRWRVGRAVPSAPSYELALGEASWIYTEETPGWTTKPECARPRAQQRPTAGWPCKIGPRLHCRDLLRPRTGALRCSLCRGLGGISENLSFCADCCSIVRAQPLLLAPSPSDSPRCRAVAAGGEGGTGGEGGACACPLPLPPLHWMERGQGG